MTTIFPSSSKPRFNSQSPSFLFRAFCTWVVARRWRRCVFLWFPPLFPPSGSNRKRLSNLLKGYTRQHDDTFHLSLSLSTIPLVPSKTDSLLVPNPLGAIFRYTLDEERFPLPQNLRSDHQIPGLLCLNRSNCQYTTQFRFSSPLRTESFFVSLPTLGGHSGDQQSMLGLRTDVIPPHFPCHDPVFGVHVQFLSARSASFPIVHNRPSVQFFTGLTPLAVTTNARKPNRLISNFFLQGEGKDKREKRFHSEEQRRQPDRGVDKNDDYLGRSIQGP